MPEEIYVTDIEVTQAQRVLQAMGWRITRVEKEGDRIVIVAEKEAKRETTT